MSVRDLFDEAADTALAGRTNVDLTAVRDRARQAGKVHRRRQAGSVLLAAAAVVVLVLGLQFGAGSLLGGPRAATPAHGAARVPGVVYLPPAWTPSLAERPVARAVYVVSALEDGGAGRPYAAADGPVVIDADSGDYRRLPWRTGDHDVVLSPDGTRAAWARDAGATTPGEQVVVATMADGRTTTLPVPSLSGQGARVTSLSFAPDGDGLAVATSDGTGATRDAVLVRDLPDGDWRQVCACRGPLGWSGDGALLVDGVVPAMRLEAKDGMTAGARQASVPVRATAEATVAWATEIAPGAALGMRVALGTTPLTLTRGARGEARLRSADDRVGADLQALPAPSVRAGEGVRRDLVVGASRASVTLSRTLQDADGAPVASAVQSVRLSAATTRALPVRTISQVEGGRAVVVAVAQGLLDAAPIETAAAPAPQRGSDPDWWRYQLRRGWSGLLGDGHAWWLLTLPVLGLAVLFWRRRRDPFAVGGPRGPRAAFARYLDPRRARSRATFAPVQEHSRAGDVVRSMLCLTLLLGGAGVLAVGTLGEHAARAGTPEPVNRVTMPEVLRDWGAAPQARITGSDARTRRLSLLLTRGEGDQAQLLGLDADSGGVVSLQGLGAEDAWPGLSGGAGPVAISPNGRIVTQFQTDGGRLLVIDLTSGDVRHTGLTVSIAPDSGAQGRLSDRLAVADDGTVLMVTLKGALWRFGPEGSGLEFKRFGSVAGVAAQPSGRFLLWRHFGDDGGPARLDLVDPITGSVKCWMTWDQPGDLSPVAAEAPGNRLLVRTDDGRVVLHHVDAGGVVDDQVLGRMPQADWFGATGDGALVTLTAPDENLADGATLAVASWTAIGDSGRPDAVAATQDGGAGQGVTRIDLAGARVAPAPAVVAAATAVAPRTASTSWTRHLAWAADDPWRTWLLPVGVALVLAGLVWSLLLLAGPARRVAGRAWRRVFRGRIEA